MIYTIQLNRRFRVLGYLTSFTYQQNKQKETKTKTKKQKEACQCQGPRIELPISFDPFFLLYSRKISQNCSRHMQWTRHLLE